jgi:hypothetical protein
MTILHIRLTSNNQNISISKELRAQKTTLLRATIFKDTGATGIYNGSLFFDIDWFNGYQYVSNLNDNYLMIPVSDETTASLQTYQMNQQLDSEDVKQSFNVKTLILNTSGVYAPATFGSGSGHIKFVDLFFQLSQLEDYNKIF